MMSSWLRLPLPAVRIGTVCAGQLTFASGLTLGCGGAILYYSRYVLPSSQGGGEGSGNRLRIRDGGRLESGSSRPDPLISPCGPHPSRTLFALHWKSVRCTEFSDSTVLVTKPILSAPPPLARVSSPPVVLVVLLLLTSDEPWGLTSYTDSLLSHVSDATREVPVRLL